jgi:hypothetical protein
MYSTAVPGLVAKRHGNPWVLVHEPSGLHLTFSGVGYFPRLKDARAAAERIARLTDWTQSAEALGPSLPGLRNALYDALTDTTSESREAAREAADRRARGLTDRDAADELASRQGHQLSWIHYGAKSFRGECIDCKAEARVAYDSCSRSYRRYGVALFKPCPKEKRTP